MTDDLRTRADRAIARLGSDEWFSEEAAVIASLLEALAAAEQQAQALREQLLEAERAGASRWTQLREHPSADECPTYHDGCNCTVENLLDAMTRAEQAESNRAEAERRAFEAGYRAWPIDATSGRWSFRTETSAVDRAIEDQELESAYCAYQQAKESPESDARTTNQQTRQG